MLRWHSLRICSPETEVGVVTAHGVFLSADSAWLSPAEAEREELEAAAIVGEQFGLEPSALLASISGVRATEVGAISRCGGVDGAWGCTRVSIAGIWIDLRRTGDCARVDATYRHEIAHAMLVLSDHDDAGHSMRRMWALLDARGGCR